MLKRVDGNRLTTKSIERIRKLRKEGLTRQKIANMLGVDEKTVRRHTQDLPNAFPPNKRIDSDKLWEMVEEGYTYSQIAFQMGVSTSAVGEQVLRIRRRIKKDIEKEIVRGKRSNRMTDEQIAMVHQFRQEGHTMREIASRLGFSAPAIVYRLKTAREVEVSSA